MKLKPPDLSPFLYIVALLAAALVVHGCAASGPPVPLGQSYRAAIAGQVLNPEGPLDRTPVVSTPGSVAEGIFQTYRESFEGEDDLATPLDGLLLEP